MSVKTSFAMGDEDDPQVDPNAETQISPSPIENDARPIIFYKPKSGIHKDIVRRLNLRYHGSTCNGNCQTDVHKDIVRRLNLRYRGTPYYGGRFKYRY